MKLRTMSELSAAQQALLQDIAAGAAARWHFNTHGTRWPEADFIQVRLIDEGDPLCDECVTLEAEMFPPK